MNVFAGLVLLLVSPLGGSSVWYAHDQDFAYGLTAAHCCDKTDIVTAIRDGRCFDCRVIARDPVRDIALIKCDKVHVGSVCIPLSSASVGEHVVLMGYPASQATVTEGVVSSQRLFSAAAEKQVVSTAQPIIGGFSGGALLAEDGLVGIVTHSAAGGAGCSILDKIVDRGVSTAATKTEASIESHLTPSLRDIIVLILGWLSRWYFPGANMVTSVHHKEKIDELRSRVPA